MTKSRLVRHARKRVQGPCAMRAAVGGAGYESDCRDEGGRGRGGMSRPSSQVRPFIPTCADRGAMAHSVTSLVVGWGSGLVAQARSHSRSSPRAAARRHQRQRYAFRLECGRQAGFRSVGGDDDGPPLAAATGRCCGCGPDSRRLASAYDPTPHAAMRAPLRKQSTAGRNIGQRGSRAQVMPGELR